MPVDSSSQSKTISLSVAKFVADCEELRRLSRVSSYAVYVSSPFRLAVFGGDCVGF